MPRVLVVEDDELILDLVSTELRHEHYFVETATNGEAALQMLKLNDYDLLILDWNVPKVSGVDICRKLRFAGDRLPVLLMTGKTKTAEKVLGFDSGADDYLTKPFDVEELLVRAKALLRRASSNVTQGVLKVGGIELDVTAYQVTKDGTEIKLIPKEFAILETLM